MATEADMHRGFGRRSSVLTVDAAVQPTRFLCGCRDCAFSSEEWTLSGGYPGGIRFTVFEAQTPDNPAGLVSGIALQTANG
jgi:hypothetical protein